MRNKKFIIFSIFILILLYLPVKANAAPLSQLLNVFVSNWPEIFSTREQNLDGNGNIKVAEQGTVSVTMSNSSPIPVSIQHKPFPNSPKWEYIFTCTASTSLVESVLDQNGKVGWELVSTDITPSGSHCLYFKRPLE